MILPESLHPSITRGGFSYRTRVPVRQEDKEKYPVSEQGLWLPLLEVGARELTVAQARFDRVRPSSLTEGERLAQAAFRAVKMHDKSGCWIDDTLDAADHLEMLWQIADQDMGGSPLDEKSEAAKKALRLCDEEGCLNARHYDLTHRKRFRDTLQVIEKSHFTILPDGRVLPIWEADQSQALPSVEDSKKALRELQLRCPPFTDPEHSPLTANGISKITLEPTTGCWVVRMYYTRPNHHELRTFQYDGYGRLGRGKLIRREGTPANQALAHRVVWEAVGNILLPGAELNHKCGFRPCVNPSHLEQVTKSENNRHMYRMKLAKVALENTPQAA